MSTCFGPTNTTICLGAVAPTKAFCMTAPKAFCMTPPTNTKSFYEFQTTSCFGAVAPSKPCCEQLGDCCLLTRGPVPMDIPGRFSLLRPCCNEQPNCASTRGLSDIQTAACPDLKFAFDPIDYWTFDPCWVAAATGQRAWIRNPLGECYNQLTFAKPTKFVNRNALWDVQVY